MNQQSGASAAIDIGAYCRAVEAYLCRMNGGHLVRIVGPAFELVAGWAREGIPERIVLHGVDRTLTRLSKKGPRRRPVRIEFCEADVRDAYDQWRRAVGVRAAPPPEPTGETAPAPAAGRTPSLPRHLERTLLKLSSVAASQALPAGLAPVVETTIREIDRCLDESRSARGEARAALAERLREIDARLGEAAGAALDSQARAALNEQVRLELAPYREQMPAAAFRDAARALSAELARRRFGLPQVRLDV